jgi:hypothetical protein
LLASLGSGEDHANPARLLWIGKDPVEFDLVAGALRDARIPANSEQGLGGLVGSLLNSESKIHVLHEDFVRALEIAEAAIAGRRVGRGATQICHTCSKECSGALTACPACKAVLIVEPEKDSERSIAKTANTSISLKYCPLCDAAYTEVHKHCTICGVDLVPEAKRGSPLSEQVRKERLEVAWRGGDPVAVSRVIAALREAGIWHSVAVTHDYYVFGLAMPYPRHEVRVFACEIARAKELLAGIPEGSTLSDEGRSGLGKKPANASEVTERRTEEPWNPAAATVEVWSGQDAALLHVLEDCLRENRIGFRRAGREPGITRLSVMPRDQAAAREIIREVREASPPA